MSRFTFHLLFLTSCLITSAFSGFTQEWVLKNPLPTNAKLNDVCLINRDTGFACGDYQTILKTTDGGLTWLHKGLPDNNQLNGIAFSCRDTGFAVGWRGILRTLDCGESWQQLPSPYTSTPTDLVDVFFLDKQRGWICGSYYGIIRTLDGGMTWQVLSHNVSGPFQSNDIIKFISPDTGFVAGSKNMMEDGVLKKTVNGGNTWTDVLIPAEIDAVSGMEVLNQNEIWIGALNQVSTPNGAATRIYHSLDCGITWSSTDLVYSGATVNSIKFFDPMHGRVLCGYRMFTTSNGGIDWEEYILSFDMPPLRAMNWADTSKCLSVGFYGYVFNSENGGQDWNEVSQGTKASFNDIFFPSSQIGFAVGFKFYQAAIFKTINGGDAWTGIPVDSLTPGHLKTIFFSDESNGWAAGYWGLLLHSTNAGQTWDSVDPGQEISYYSLNLVTGKYIWAGGYQSKLIRSSDFGSTWQDISLSNTAYDIKKITFLDSLNGYVTLVKPYDINHGLMFRTSDGGVSWIPIDFINNETKGVLSMSFTDAETGYISIYNEGMAKTSDGGISWQSLGKIGSIVPTYIKFTNSQQGIACYGDHFVANTNNGCETWDTLISSIPQANYIRSYFFTGLNKGWLAGWNGLIKAYTSVGVGTNEQNSADTGEPGIFPNPAEDLLTFSFTEGIIQAKIYTLQGKIVKTINGTNLKIISTKDLTPGNYILGLSTSNSERFLRFIKH